MVSARRLRKSLLKDVDIDGLGVLTGVGYENSIKEKSNNNSHIKISKFKKKIIFHVFSSVFIIFACLVFKLGLYEKVKGNMYIEKIKTEYSKNYEKSEILDLIENFITRNKETISYILPSGVTEKIKNAYRYKFKESYINFSIKNLFDKYLVKAQNNNNNSSLYVFSNSVVSAENETDDKKEYIEAINENINPIDTISTVDIDVEKIKSKNIDIKSPVNGKITSEYGAREVIFEDIGTFHTGVDIANVLNTEIKSATNGIVTKCEKNNKYWGNYIIITIDEVSFRYAHLNGIGVSEGQEINQGQIIGKMGSTGYSTGSHLHFEISIESRSVDPQKLVEL